MQPIFEPSFLEIDHKRLEEHDLKLLRQRDPVFLENLFTKLNPALLRVMGSRGIFAENAEELVHECWHTFFENLDQFQGRSQLKTFLIGILINKIREERRRQGKVDYEEDSEKVFARSFTKDGWWAREPESPEALVENTELGSLIMECLEGLSEMQKSAFLLVESSGESPEDACNILGVSATNLRVLLFRAKDKLRNCLGARTAT